MTEPTADVFPTSAGQERLLLLDRVDETGVQYAIVDAARVGPGFAAGRFAECLRSVVQRHDALRTTFAWERDGPVQHVHQELQPELTVRDGIAPDDAARLLERHAQRGFDLTAGPLVRLLMVGRTDGEWDVMVSVHHTVADGLSMQVVFDEIAAFYWGAELPPPPDVQYPDWAHWQRARQVGPAMTGHLDFWRGCLAGAADLLELPWDRPRPRVQRTDGDTIRFEVGPDTVGRAVELARRLRVTPAGLFRTVFAILLARLSGQQDVTFASPVAGRDHADVEGVVGFFVNTVPLRLAIAGEAAFSSLVENASAAQLAATAHQEVPLEQIVSAVGARRDPGWHPLFQALFAWDESTGITGLAGPAGLSVRRIPVRLPTAKFDLSLTLRPTGGALEGSLEYRTDLLDAETAHRWAGCFSVLLDALLAAPGSPVAHAQMLTLAQRRQVEELGLGQRVAPTDLSLPQVWMRTVSRRRWAPAVIFEGVTLTYAELDEQSARIATRLIGDGVGPGSRVGIRMGRSALMCAAVLGVLRTGAAYVPLDPTYPSARLNFMIADADVSMLLDETMPAPSDGTDTAKDTAAGKPSSTSNADALAYVIYTSGSTGVPKGVCVTHRSVVNLAIAQGDAIGIVEDDRVAQWASTSFDVSVAEMWMTWARGAALVVLSADERVGPTLADALDRERVSVLIAAPSALATLDPRGHPQLRLVVSTGEACPPGLVESLGATSRLVNAYGPTEATVWATAAALRPGDRVNIGGALPNTSVRITDGWDVVVPLGVVGELRIGGLGVAAGYLDRPELTAERFVAGQYRTGDLARLRPDGSIILIGRVDDQVKVHGFRIELGEVEAALTSHPAISAAVVAVRNEGGTPRLVGYVVGSDVPADLRGWLGDRLPRHLVPSALRRIEAIPLNPAGKVDRAALPAPEDDASRPEIGTVYTAPSNHLELHLAAVWRSVLGLERVGVHDNFFELGGNSLLLVRVLRELNAADDLPSFLMTDLFRYPSIAALARSAQPRAEQQQAGQGADRSRGDRRRTTITRRRGRRVGASEGDGI